MTTIIKYVCDICGQVFDNEDECENHELLEKIGKYSNDIVFFRENKKVISFDDVISSPYEVYGIYVKNENAIPIIDEIFDLYGVISPWDRNGGSNRKTTGLYLYDENNDRWYLSTNKIKELKRKMKEYGVDA